MAFYTSRVDDDGNEIERRLSSRSFAPSIADSMGRDTTRNNTSSRSYDTKSSVRMSTRRYLNTAVYVENASDGSDFLPSLMCDDNGKSQKSESQSDIVPPLDLQSEDNYPTTRDYTYSYRKHCEAAKLELKPDLAYETWLSAKRKILSDEAERRKKVEKAKRQEIEDRKRLSEKQYEKWLENKARLQRKHPQTSQSSSANPVTSQPQVSISSLTHSNITEEEAKQRLDEWERTKRKQIEQRRRLKREAEERHRQLEESRRKAAAEAWANWKAMSAKKPNPVPLNRGIYTLRGTISDIFVNPNEWQPILPIIDGDGDN